MAEGKNGQSARVRHKVSLVLQLIDDFSGREIEGSNARAWISGEKPPIRKSEGYHVFTNLKEPEVQVHIEAGLYEGQTLQVKLNEDGTYTFLKIRLAPSRAYPIPRNTTCVEGRTEPDSLVRIVCLEDSNPLKLIYDYRKGKEDDGKISIYHPETMDIEGKALYIKNGKAGGEFFRVLQKREESGSYGLEQPLSRDYKKVGAVIFPVWSCNADGKGRFFLPIPQLVREDLLFLCESLGTDLRRVSRKLRTGQVNPLDFMEEGE